MWPQCYQGRPPMTTLTLRTNTHDPRTANNRAHHHQGHANIEHHKNSTHPPQQSQQPHPQQNLPLPPQQPHLPPRPPPSQQPRPQQQQPYPYFPQQPHPLYTHPQQPYTYPSPIQPCPSQLPPIPPLPHPPYLPPHPPSPLTPHPPLPHPLVDRTQELKVVENWKATISSQQPDKADVLEDIRLPNMKALLSSAYNEIESLKQLHNEVLLLATGSPAVDEIWRQVTDTKQRLEIALSQLNRKDYKIVREKVKRQKRRRDRLRCRRLQEKERKRSSLQLADDACSKWLEDKQNKELRLKLEQSVRKAASGSLAAVNKKVQDISTCTSMLATLTELRNLRHSNKRYQLPGPTMVTAQESFTSLSEELTSILECYGKVYEREAHALEVMLAEQVDTKMTSLTSRHSLPSDDPIHCYYHHAQRDLVSLVSIRQQWDSYLSHVGSCVPNKWVEPSPPTNKTWSQYLTP